MTEHPAGLAVTPRQGPPTRGFVVAALIGVATFVVWPASTVVDPTDISVSWRAALQHAADLRLHFGSDIVFTYGPLGYLTIPRFYDPVAGTMAVATIVVLCLAVMASATLVMRTRYSVVATVLGAFVVARSLAVIDPMIGPVIASLAWASVILYRGLPSRPTTLFVAAGSALGAATILMKFNTGFAILAVVAAVTIVAVPRRPWLMIVAILAASCALVGAWLIAGQELADLRPFLVGSLELATGYSAAMGLPIPDWQIPAAILTLTWVMTAVLLSGRGLAWAPRLGLFLATGSVAFFAWKHGAIRQGLDGCFAEILLISLLAIDWRTLWRPVAVGALALPMVFFAVSSPDPLAWLGVDRSIATAVDEIATALVPTAAAERARLLQGELRDAYGLSPTIVTAIAGRPTHVDGWETALVVAYPELDWRPLPVFQSYAAYTRGLDGMNAESLRSDAAPDRILRPRPRAIDGRYWLFDAPQATLEMFCRYRQVAVTLRWEVVARGPDRCGGEAVISVVTAPLGSTVEVPALDQPSSLIGVRISGIGGGLETLSSSLYRGPIWSVSLDERRYRLVPGTASGPLLLGTNAELGYADGYAISQNVGRIGIDSDAPWTTSDVTYTFFRVAVED